MKQDLFIVGGGILAVGLAIWGIWGNPRRSAQKEHVAQHLNADPELKIVSERQPFHANRTLGRSSHARGRKVRSDVGTALAAGLADETRLDVG